MTASYQVINTGGLPNACHSVTILNGSNKDITMSMDGSTDDNFIVSGASLTITSPAGSINGVKKGQLFYAKGTAGTGTVYVSGKYMAS